MKELESKVFRIIGLKSKSFLAESLREYGIDNHLFEVIEECSDDELSSKERYYQEFYDCIGENGLNSVLQGTDDKKPILSKRNDERKKRTLTLRRLKKIARDIKQNSSINKKIKSNENVKINIEKCFSLTENTKNKVYILMGKHGRSKAAKMLKITLPTLMSRLEKGDWKLTEVDLINQLSN